jgi:hypothetical protein
MGIILVLDVLGVVEDTVEQVCCSRWGATVIDGLHTCRAIASRPRHEIKHL